MTDLIKGAGQRSVKSYSPVTGLGTMVPVAVNPTNEEYTKITGREVPFTFNYDLVERKLGEDSYQCRPIRILVQNTEKGTYDSVIFYISANQIKTSKGSLGFMNCLGRFTYAKSEDILKSNDRMKWFTDCGVYPAYQGMPELYHFLQELTKFNFSDESANWMRDMQDNGCDVDTLVSGNVEGLKKIINWSKSKGMNAVTGLYTVRCKNEGTAEEKPIQNIETGSAKLKLFFMADTSDPNNPKVPNSVYKRLKDSLEERKKVGLGGINKYFTYKLQDFKKEDCVNHQSTGTSAEEAASTISNVDKYDFI